MRRGFSPERERQTRAGNRLIPRMHQSSRYSRCNAARQQTTRDGEEADGRKVSRDGVGGLVDAGEPPT